MAAIKLKRRNTGGALVPGTAPLNTGAGGVLSGEAVWDNVANILYIGGGDDGAGNSTSIRTVAGTGAFVPFGSVGAVNGVASLDATGKVPSTQIPAVAGTAPLASPAFTGTPTAPTASAGTNTTQLATTAFVAAALTAFTPSGIDGGVI